MEGCLSVLEAEMGKKRGERWCVCKGPFVKIAKMTARGERVSLSKLFISVLDSSSLEESWGLVNWSFSSWGHRGSERLTTRDLTPINS